MITKRKSQEKKSTTKRLAFKRDTNLEFNFRDFMSFKSIYYKSFLIENAEIKQDEFNPVLHALKI